MEHWDPSVWTHIGRGRLGILDLVPVGVLALTVLVAVGLRLI